MNQKDQAVDGVIKPFVFKTVSDIYSAPQERVSFCVDNLLPFAGLSVLAGKPKSGKTTLARQLAVAISQGLPFLGRKTQQGSVLYMALEEKQSEVAEHFQSLGLCESDPVRILCGAVQKHNAIAMLSETLQTARDINLIIIDPIFRFVGVKDINAYIDVSDALERLLELARKSGVHILTAHHLKKREPDDIMDGTLGSTAIAGGVDTFIALKADSAGTRTLCTRQRYGKDMEPTKLTWDEESRELSLGLTCAQDDRLTAERLLNRISEDIIGYVTNHPGCTQQAFMHSVRGKRTAKLRILQQLIESTQLLQSGKGVKGDPHTYCWKDVPMEA
jgi:archaellum biogenesis ATPase FlaH